MSKGCGARWKSVFVAITSKRELGGNWGKTGGKLDKKVESETQTHWFKGADVRQLTYSY